MEITKEDLQNLCSRYDELLEEKTKELYSFTESMQSCLTRGHHASFIEMTGRLVGKNNAIELLLAERVKYKNALYEFAQLEIKEDARIPKGMALFVVNGKIVGAIKNVKKN
jgi:hypothetical protein